MYGLLGQHLSHSFSPQIHNMLGDYEYKLFEKEPEQVGEFLNQHPFEGINVTIPYKKTVMPYLDNISDQAEAIGSVNTIKVKNGKLYGDNTDYFGFLSMIRKSGISVSGKKVLVLGTGGASMTVLAVLRDLNAGEIISISRSGKNNYSNIKIHSDAEIIVNTTPVGMYPNNLKSPVSLNQFPRLQGVLDLIYNPLKTLLLLEAEKLGIPAVSGLNMLVAQAVKANEIFFGRSLDLSVIDKTEKALIRQQENIILIGMPGCGKTSVGKELAGLTGKTFIDTDELTEETAGCDIPSLINEKGEKYFRNLETESAEKAGKTSSRIIATGGGIVTSPENEYPLRQNGITVFLKRDLSELPTDGRPLSQKEGLSRLYEQRLPLYKKFADITVENSGTVSETAEKIKNAIENL